MLRPVNTSKSFDLALDTLTCLWGGLIAPKLCEVELKTKLKAYPNLISFASSFGEDAHLSKENYFNICASTDRFREVANNACCLVAVFAFENLKTLTSFDSIRNEVAVNFLRHLRNASAHGNQFNFIDTRNKSFVDPGVVNWKGKIIDKSLQGKTAFPDFFSQGDFAFLFEDISSLL